MNTIKTRHTLRIFFLGLLALIAACGQGGLKDPTLKKAFTLREEAIEFRSNIQYLLENIKRNKDSLFVADYGEEVIALSNALIDWDKRMATMPTQKRVTQEKNSDTGSMLSSQHHLELQQQLLSEIEDISEKVTYLNKLSKK